MSVCRIVIVCEGQRDSRFARSFLTAAGIDPRKLLARPNPGGSGHDWVKREFVVEVEAMQRFREGRGVLGLLDEDGQGVAFRSRQIAQRLDEKGLPGLDASQGRCLILPTRNLETWLLWLEARRSARDWSINEEDDYKIGPPNGVSNRDMDGFCRSAGEFLHSLNHEALPDNCLLELASSLRQLRDFLRSVRHGPS